MHDLPIQRSFSERALILYERNRQWTLIFPLKKEFFYLYLRHFMLLNYKNVKSTDCVNVMNPKKIDLKVPIPLEIDFWPFCFHIDWNRYSQG